MNKKPDFIDVLYKIGIVLLGGTAALVSQLRSDRKMEQAIKEDYEHYRLETKNEEEAE